MLPEEKRQQLDMIVQDMLRNKESESNIRFVVDDFKAKYDQPESQPNQQTGNTFENQSTGEKIFSSANPYEGKGQALEALGNVAGVYSNLNKGIVKSGAGLVQGAVNLGGQAVNYAKNKITGENNEYKPINLLPEYATEADGAMQNVGKVAGDIATFFVPGGAVAKAGKLWEAGVAGSKVGKLAAEGSKIAGIASKATNLAGKSALSGAEFGGVSALQKGDAKEGLDDAKLGALFPVGGAIIGKMAGSLGGMSKNLAKKIEQVSLRLTPVQKRDLGKKLDQVTEFLSNQGITGSPEQRFEKVNALYQSAEETLSNFIKQYAPTVAAKTDNIVSQVSKIAEKYKNDRDIVAVEKQLEEFINMMKTKHPGQISLDALNELKRSTFSGAYNKAGSKVLDTVEHEIGSVLRKNVEKITEGLKVDGQDIGTFNKGYGTLIEARKLLDIAKSRPELGAVGKLISTSVGGAVGTAIGGALGAGVGMLAGQQSGKLVAGTAMRSQVEKLLMKLSKVGKVTESEAGTIKGFLFGNKKATLSPKEQKIADKIAERLNKPNVGLGTRDISAEADELRKSYDRMAKAWDTASKKERKNISRAMANIIKQLQSLKK